MTEANVAATADERVKQQSSLQKALIRPELGGICGTIIVFALFLIFAGDSGMFSAQGVMNWSTVSAQFMIIAVGACLLMIAGEFDLSVGSMIGFSGMMIAIFTVTLEWPVWQAILVTFVMAHRDWSVERLHRGAHRTAELHRNTCISVHPARLHHLSAANHRAQDHHRRGRRRLKATGSQPCSAARS
jgi:hypothetical protein